MHQQEFNPQLVRKLRDFFIALGTTEIFPQAKLSILAACEDPTTVVAYEIGGEIWPLPQTNQMNLEEALLLSQANGKDKSGICPGYFCLTTSYRDEPPNTYIEGRHRRVFTMLEFELLEEIATLEEVLAMLIQHLALPGPVSLDYLEACEILKTLSIGPTEETALAGIYGPVIFLQSFPEQSNPFWNMKKGRDGNFHKIDVLINGVEVIGSATRSTDPNQMRKFFYQLNNGRYAKTLFNLFSKERVERELEEFINLPMIPRSGGGIGLARLDRALKNINHL